MQPIESERLRLRAIEPDRDAAPMLALLNDPGFVRFIGDRNVRDEEQAREYIALRVLHSYALNGFGMYAIERLSDGAWMGNAGLVRRDGLPGPDIGYAVLSQFAGQGYAGEAARAVFAHARGALGLHDLYGITDLDNVVSGKILLGLGMQERGVIQLPGVDSPSRLYATLGAAGTTGCGLQPRSSSSCACSSATAASSRATRSARPGSATSLLPPPPLAYFAASAAPSTSPHSRCM